MKSTVKKLYQLIIKLVILLENELNALSANNQNIGNAKKKQNTLSIQKSITDTLNKIVSLIVQLNKISKDNILITEPVMTIEDKKIIEQFLTKYNKKIK